MVNPKHLSNKKMIAKTEPFPKLNFLENEELRGKP